MFTANTYNVYKVCLQHFSASALKYPTMNDAAYADLWDSIMKEPDLDKPSLHVPSVTAAFPAAPANPVVYASAPANPVPIVYAPAPANPVVYSPARAVYAPAPAIYAPAPANPVVYAPDPANPIVYASAPANPVVYAPAPANCHVPTPVKGGISFQELVCIVSFFYVLF
jgi:penicillin-binding protein 1A